jgi:outer membrane protein OmpA-like peptidoglycan-associated protein
MQNKSSGFGGRGFFLVLWALLLSLVRPGAEEFLYKHRAGDAYRVLSTVNEEVYLNRTLSHQAEILNRIAVKVLSVTGGAGRHEAVFQTSERTSRAGTAGSFAVPPAPGSFAAPPAPGSFQWAREYESVFDRDLLGRLKIDSRYFMPVVRDVPVFPGRDLKPGDTWTAPGHEMHDFRDSFGIAEPYRIPFEANYRYLGTRIWKGVEYPAFSVSYRISNQPPAVRGRLWPRRITGASDQIVYWESRIGQARAYEESFRMIFELSDGTIVEYRGTAQAEILESPEMDKEGIAGEIAGDLKRMGVEDARVRVDQEGVTISLEDIRFEAESAILRPGEQAKLDKIAEILSRYPGRDILVGGHTALAGTESGRQTLSTQRAATVADYLIGKEVRSSDRVVVRGYGAERPVADNRTEAGMARNRRVEITILEN